MWGQCRACDFDNALLFLRQFQRRYALSSSRAHSTITDFLSTGVKDFWSDDWLELCMKRPMEIKTEPGQSFQTHHDQERNQRGQHHRTLQDWKNQVALNKGPTVVARDQVGEGHLLWILPTWMGYSLGANNKNSRPKEYEEERNWIWRRPILKLGMWVVYFHVKTEVPNRALPLIESAG